MERTPSQYAMIWMMQHGRKNFLERLGQEESEPEEEDREEQQQPVPKLKTFKEAISALENVQSFVEDRDTSVKQQQSAQQ